MKVVQKALQKLLNDKTKGVFLLHESNDFVARDDICIYEYYAMKIYVYMYDNCRSVLSLCHIHQEPFFADLRIVSLIIQYDNCKKPRFTHVDRVLLLQELHFL
jgi:hypothetical protein